MWSSKQKINDFLLIEFDTVIQLLIVRLTLFIILLVVTVLTSMVVISNIYTLLMQLPWKVYCIYFFVFSCVNCQTATVVCER